MPANERLRTLINEAGITIDAISDNLGVNRRTVERWIGEGRIPYPRHRVQLAEILNQDQRYLWPDLEVPEARRSDIARTEIVTVYPRRALVPTALWLQLVERATVQIDLLVQVALFLPEQQPKLAKILSDKVADGTKVRIMLGDPDGESVVRRGEEEGIGNAIVAKVRNVLTFYEDFKDNLDIRLHDTTLYNSIYRFDQDMIVNNHIYGQPAAHNPALHLRHVDGGELFADHAETFDRIWYNARPAWETTT